MEEDTGASRRIQLSPLIRLAGLLSLLFSTIAVLLLLIGRGMSPQPQIAFQSDRTNDWEIYLVDAGSHIDVRLTFSPGIDYSPAWSPDGTRIAYTGIHNGFFDVYVLDTDMHTVAQVTDDFATNSKPRWFSNNELTYIVEEDFEAEGIVYLLDLRTDMRQQIGMGRSTLLAPIPSPDGNHEVFISHAGPFMDIFVAARDRTWIQNISAHPGHDNYPTWSNDGGWVAFASRRDGNWEIYVVRADGSDLTRVTYDAGDDIAPSWRPN
ncbi:MAG: hypothetical protein SF123_22200 [Chloroflexota bacterium]|nr:hypothetical protein [Chloroflexota bacterium]